MKYSMVFVIIELVGFAIGISFFITAILTPKPATYDVQTFLGIPYAYNLNPDFIHAFAHMVSFVIIGISLMAFSLGIAIANIYIGKLEKKLDAKQ